MMNCEFAARNFELDDKLKDYVTEKIGGLDRYLPRAHRDNASASVLLEQDSSGREDNRYVCEVAIKADGTTLFSREGTVNMYAAVDIVEAKLKAQAGKFKGKSTLEPRRARMMGRLLGRRSEQPDSEQSLT